MGTLRDPGMISLIFRSLFGHLSEGDDKENITIKISFYTVRKEKIYDLLVPTE
jgi:hypothetical protein